MTVEILRNHKQKLHDKNAKWPMEPALVSVVLSRWESDSLTLDETLIYRSVAPSRCWYSFTNPIRMESWVSLNRKGHRNIQISAEPKSNWGHCGWKAEILPTAPTMPARHSSLVLQKKKKNKKKKKKIINIFLKKIIRLIKYKKSSP